MKQIFRLAQDDRRRLGRSLSTVISSGVVIAQTLPPK